MGGPGVAHVPDDEVGRAGGQFDAAAGRGEHRGGIDGGQTRRRLGERADDGVARFPARRVTNRYGVVRRIRASERQEEFDGRLGQRVAAGVVSGGERLGSVTPNAGPIGLRRLSHVGDQIDLSRPVDHRLVGELGDVVAGAVLERVQAGNGVAHRHRNAGGRRRAQGQRDNLAGDGHSGGGLGGPRDLHREGARRGRGIREHRPVVSQRDRGAVHRCAQERGGRLVYRVAVDLDLQRTGAGCPSIGVVGLGEAAVADAPVRRSGAVLRIAVRQTEGALGGPGVAHVPDDEVGRAGGQFDAAAGRGEHRGGIDGGQTRRRLGERADDGVARFPARRVTNRYGVVRRIRASERQEEFDGRLGQRVAAGVVSGGERLGSVTRYVGPIELRRLLGVSDQFDRRRRPVGHGSIGQAGGGVAVGVPDGVGGRHRVSHRHGITLIGGSFQGQRHRLDGDGHPGGVLVGACALHGEGGRRGCGIGVQCLVVGQREHGAVHRRARQIGGRDVGRVVRHGLAVERERVVAVYVLKGVGRRLDVVQRHCLRRGHRRIHSQGDDHTDDAHVAGVPVRADSPHRESTRRWRRVRVERFVVGQCDRGPVHRCGLKGGGRLAG